MDDFISLEPMRVHGDATKDLKILMFRLWDFKKLVWIDDVFYPIMNWLLQENGYINRPPRMSPHNFGKNAV